MNNIILIGRLTRDVELRYIAGTGTPVAQFTIAVDKFNEKFDEYGELVAGDISYGSRKLKERIKQIMKE